MIDPLMFRNSVSKPSDPIETWGTEVYNAVLDYGGIEDWRPFFAAIRAEPHGEVAQRMERLVARRPWDGVSAAFTVVTKKARGDADAFTQPWHPLEVVEPDV